MAPLRAQRIARMFVVVMDRNSAALPMRSWNVQCAGPFFIMCVRPRAPDVGNVAGQDGAAHNGGNGHSEKKGPGGRVERPFDVNSGE